MSDEIDYEYVVYIDEAGDPGLRKVFPIDPDGATEWLVIGAVLTRKRYEAEVVDWVREIRENIGIKQRLDLHFRTLSPTRKLSVCRQLRLRPIRAFAVLSNKKNMRRYDNPRAAKRSSKQWFYNYCVRLLLERVTDACYRSSMEHRGCPEYLKIVFSQRGGHSYSQTQAYYEILGNQSRSNSTYLQKRQIKWQVMRRALFEHHPHNQVAGLQLADTVSSAFFQACDVLGPTTEWDVRYAQALRKIMATENGVIADYGVCLQPMPPWKAKLTDDQRKIFRFYGFAI